MNSRIKSYEWRVAGSGGEVKRKLKNGKAEMESVGFFMNFVLFRGYKTIGSCLV